MFQSRGSNLGKRTGRNDLVAVAIDKPNKVSQYALKWAVDHLLSKGQTIILIHVAHTNSSLVSYTSENGIASDISKLTCKEKLETQTKDMFLTFHCYCTRKEIQCLDVILEHRDIVKALSDYVSSSGIENLVLGASKHGFMRRLRVQDIPTNVIKGAPDFCTVYVISKTKISSVRNASRIAPFTSPLLSQIQNMQVQSTSPGNSPDLRRPSFGQRGTPRFSSNGSDSFRSPLLRGKCLSRRMFGEPPDSDTDISFVSSGRPSTDRMSSIFGESIDSGRTSGLSTSSESSYESMRLGAKASDSSSLGFSSSSLENEDVENEMRRLKVELQRTLEMYSTACKEALSAQQKASELQHWRKEEERRLDEAKQLEEGELEVIHKELAENKVSVDHADAALRISELESEKRINLEMKILRDVSEKQNIMSSLNGFMYRRYPIDEIEEATEYFSDSRKVGEGGYGPVFKCYLDHTPVAVKVLRADAAQGRSQFQKEVEVLSCMRHPNLVLLLGACPEYGCLVYEYMANGSLEDRLFRRGGTPALSWQHRFRIAAEITTGLHFLHQTKPEPLVHRDLKPSNVLLDRNFTSKISDVGLARLVPPSVADDVTHCCITSTAGTLCYIDPEYQQTGMLGVKSDVYSLGIVYLQLLTAKPAKGLTQYVGLSIENETFSEMLDPAVPDWPLEDAMSLAKLALQCSELKRKDRPDLNKVVLPQLNKLRELAYENLGSFQFGFSAPSPNDSNASMTRGVPSGEQTQSAEHSSKSIQANS